MTNSVVQSPAVSIDHWQFAWQWSPAIVVGLAAVAAVVAVASVRRGRGSSSMRLATFAARVVAIAMLVVMLSGWRVAPKGLPDVAMDRCAASLAVQSPRIVRLGDAVCIDAVYIDADAGLPKHAAGERTATADLTDADGATIASAPLLSNASSGPLGRPEGHRSCERAQGRILWRPASVGSFSGFVRIRGGEAAAAAPVSFQVTDEPLRVFLLDRPRFESRFLSGALSRDPRFAVAARFLGPGSPSDDAAELPSTREDWNRFDVVVLGAIDPLAIPEPAAAALVEAAAKDGVGVVWSLDAASDPEAIAVSPLGRLLPFRAVSRHPPSTTPREIQRAAAGEEAAWLAVADDSLVSRDAWRTMPSVYAAIEPTVIRPTARVMATCNSLATVAGANRPTSPFILVDQAGEARIVAFLAETWRLRQGARGPLVDRVLSQALLHAAEPHLASRFLADAPAGLEPKPDAASRTTVPRPPDEIESPTFRPLWNHPAILLALLAACGVEWWLRARLGDGP